jgi:hypothetical protein
MVQPNLALVGMHGPPEKTGLALLQSHVEDPVDGWDVEIANQAAVDAGRRYMVRNMTNAFGGEPPDEQTAENYELWRPHEIRRSTYGRSTVLDIHDGPLDTGEYVAFGGVFEARLLGVAALLDIQSIVTQNIGSLGDFNDRTAVIEMCRDDDGDSPSRIANNVRRLRHCMQAIAAGDIPAVHPREFDHYRHALEISNERAAALGLIDGGLRLQPYDPIPQELSICCSLILAISM